MPTPHTLIRPFRDGDGAAFRDLNLAWIRQHWTPEAGDWASLGSPEDKILAPGGAIFMAEVQGEVKGCCALMHHGGGRFELAKMAVDPSAQGLGLGAALGEAVIAEAALRKATVERHLATLEPALRASARAGLVALVALSGGLAEAAARAAALTLAVAAAARIRL